MRRTPASLAHATPMVLSAIHVSQIQARQQPVGKFCILIHLKLIPKEHFFASILLELLLFVTLPFSHSHSLPVTFLCIYVCACVFVCA